MRERQLLYGMERLAHHMMSPSPHPGRRLKLSEHDALELVNDQNNIRGIGSDGTLLPFGRSSRNTPCQPPRGGL